MWESRQFARDIRSRCRLHGVLRAHAAPDDSGSASWPALALVLRDSHLASVLRRVRVTLAPNITQVIRVGTTVHRARHSAGSARPRAWRAPFMLLAPASHAATRAQSTHGSGRDADRPRVLRTGGAAGVGHVPVARVFRREATGTVTTAPRRSVGDEAAIAAPVGEYMRDRITARSASPSPSLTEHELQRMADTVLQKIDRRLRAYRERSGRV